MAWGSTGLYEEAIPHPNFGHRNLKKNNPTAKAKCVKNSV